MKKSRFSEAQIVGILKEVEMGVKVGETCRKHGVSEQRACQASHGFGLLYDSARHQGKPWGKTVLWRVYCELRLNLPRRGKKRQPARIKQPLHAAG